MPPIYGEYLFPGKNKTSTVRHLKIEEDVMNEKWIEEIKRNDEMRMLDLTGIFPGKAAAMRNAKDFAPALVR